MFCHRSENQQPDMSTNVVKNHSSSVHEEDDDQFQENFWKSDKVIRDKNQVLQ